MAIVTSAGFVETALLLGGNAAGDPFTHIAVGASSQADNVALTTLSNELTGHLARVAATVSWAQTSYASDTVVFSHTWTATGAATVWESGVFNSSSAGNMLCYGTFANSIVMASDDTLKVTWSVQVKAGAA